MRAYLPRQVLPSPVANTLKDRKTVAAEKEQNQSNWWVDTLSSTAAAAGRKDPTVTLPDAMAQDSRADSGFRVSAPDVVHLEIDRSTYIHPRPETGQR